MAPTRQRNESSPAAAGNPGISGMALYVPPYRVDLEQWCDWTGNDWRKIRQVVGSGFRLLGPNQGVYTMAANAVLRLIRNYSVDPTRIRYLALGTESSTDNSAGAIIVKGMVDEALRALGLPPITRNCEVPEFKHACLGGIYALKGAVRFLSTDGDDSVAVVVCSDKALYEVGSSGEPTQGAGAVAMLLETKPTIASIDLRAAGTASEYRGIDFRKPLTGRLNGHAHSLDIPVYNGRYSTNCYVDEVRRALDDLYTRRRLAPAAYLRSVEAIFMHRPYARMPETGFGIAYLFALGQGGGADRDELATYCGGAGVPLDAVLAEMNKAPELGELAVSERIQDEVFPLTMAVHKVFRMSDTFRTHVHDKMALGAAAMREVGNLYTGALPAWLAAGVGEAASIGADLAGRELLAIGYGSGNAADAIPLTIIPGWESAARHIGIKEALDSAIDVTAGQYLALRGGAAPAGLSVVPAAEFVIERVGSQVGHAFQDAGVEYYRYIH
ncbi:MAG: hydroxymethylglutaryl-CoA synthase [Gammaproteobacteria bacterium]